MDNIILEIGLALGLIAFAVTLANKLGLSNIPFLIIIGLLYFLFVRQLRQAGKGALSFGKSRAKLLKSMAACGGAAGVGDPAKAIASGRGAVGGGERRRAVGGGVFGRCGFARVAAGGLGALAGVPADAARAAFQSWIARAGIGRG